MTFGVFTDLHAEVIPDADRRVEALLADFQKRQVDCIVELGDLCQPSTANRELLARLRSAGLPLYTCLGNHNADRCTPEEAAAFLGLSTPAYSFIRGAVKFIVLDANYMNSPDGCIPYSFRNYRHTPYPTPFLPPAQLAWLEQELKEDRFFVILSHHSLANPHPGRGVVNREAVRTLLENRNRREKRVLLCLNGHDHGDAVRIIRGIPYYTVNSASYIWGGQREVFAYPPALHRAYPDLKDILLYEEPLHCIVTVDEAGSMTVSGMSGRYQRVTPADAGLGDTLNGVSIRPRTSSLYLQNAR